MGNRQGTDEEVLMLCDMRTSQWRKINIKHKKCLSPGSPVFPPVLAAGCSGDKGLTSPVSLTGGDGTLSVDKVFCFFKSEPANKHLPT